MKISSRSSATFFMALIGMAILCQSLTANKARAASNLPVKSSAEKAQREWKTEWDKTVEAAKKEGSILIYSNPGVNVIRPVAQAFEQRYGIKADWIVGRGDELAQRIQTEKTAGIRAVDVIIVGSTSVLTIMKPRNLLGKIEPLLLLPEVTDPQAWITKGLPFIDKEHYTMALVATFMRYVLRNTDLVQANEITSYKDLLNPKWKGKIVMNDPRIAGSGLSFMAMLALDLWGIDGAKDFLRQLVKQEPVITRERRLQVEWLARGKYALSVATAPEAAIEFMKLAAPVAYCKVKEGGKVGAGSGGLAVPEKPAHPNAAKVFVNWILSKEGQNALVKAYGSPGVRKDSTREGIPPQMYPDPGEVVFFETEEFILFKDEASKMSTEILAPLFK